MIAFSVTILVGILAMIGILCYKFWWDFKVEKTKKPFIPHLPVSFDNDVQFLHYLIQHKLKQTKIFILEPSRLAGRPMINDKEFEERKDQLVEDVYSSLSRNYKIVLSKYFNQEGLAIYITEQIYSELSAMCLHINHQAINSNKN